MATPHCTWNRWLLALCEHVKHTCGKCSAVLLKDGRPITSRLLPDYLISLEAGLANATGEGDGREEGSRSGVAV